MECPVCHYKEIQEGSKLCINCGADLEAFQTIEKIKKSRKKGSILSIILGILSAIFLIACIIIYLSFNNKVKTAENETLQAKSEINKLTTQIDQNNSKIASLSKKINELQTNVTEAETLKNK